MTTYTATLTDAARTEISVTVDPNGQFAQYYGLVQAIIEAARKTPAYKTAREAEDAEIGAVWIDGEEITQF